MIKGAIFDLDGTLLDSMNLWTKIDREFLERRGITYTLDYSKAITHMELLETANYTIKRYSLNESAEAVIGEWHEAANKEYANNIILKDGAYEFLMYLKKNNYKLAVATSSSKEVFMPCLKRVGIDKLFDAIVTSSDVGVGKSSPKIYLHGASLINVEPKDCFVFEDLPIALASAKSAGFITIGVLDPFSIDLFDEIKAQSMATISDFSEKEIKKIFKFDNSLNYN